MEEDKKTDLEPTPEVLDKQTEEKNMTEEQLIKELDSVAKEILSRQTTEKQEKERKQLTNPSAIALTTPSADTGQSLAKMKKSVKQLFALYLTNQYVARATDVRADTIISKGYEIINGSEEGQKKCKELIERSGGINLFRQISINTDIAGDGFLEKIYNKNKTAITRLKHVHPLTLGFKKNKTTDKIIVDSNKEPVGYVQIFIDKEGNEQFKPVDKDKIEHLRYNILGDEFTGISTIQPVYDTIIRLMNMEYSAAEAAVKTANPLIIGKCNTKSPHQIAQWSTILGRVSGKEQIFIPEGMEIDFKSPGAQNFSEYSEYFLNAVVSGFGVPRSVLLGEGSSGNRAEGVILSRHFYSLIKSLQRYQEDFFNKIFREYAEISGFDAPQIAFNDIAEDAHLMAQSAIELFTASIIDRDEAREMIGLDKKSINEKKTKSQSVSEDIKKADRQVQFPETPGKVSGSQKGIKAEQKNNPNSLVSSATK